MTEIYPPLFPIMDFT